MSHQSFLVFGTYQDRISRSFRITPFLKIAWYAGLVIMNNRNTECVWTLLKYPDHPWKGSTLSNIPGIEFFIATYSWISTDNDLNSVLFYYPHRTGHHLLPCLEMRFATTFTPLPGMDEVAPGPSVSRRSKPPYTKDDRTPGSSARDECPGCRLRPGPVINSYRKNSRFWWNRHCHGYSGRNAPGGQEPCW